MTLVPVRATGGLPWRPVLGLALFLALWEAVSGSGIVPSSLLPPPKSDPCQLGGGQIRATGRLPQATAAATGTGCAPMPSHGRATWPPASSAATTRATVEVGTTTP